MNKDTRVCAVCGNAGTTRWTVGTGSRATFVSLCAVDSEPLRTLLEAGERATAEAGKGKSFGPELPRKQPRQNIFEPLDWTPPAG